MPITMTMTIKYIARQPGSRQAGWPAGRPTNNHTKGCSDTAERTITRPLGSRLNIYRPLARQHGMG
eukprot:5071708-Heterocapsa_arctica.AAC.1